MSTNDSGPPINYSRASESSITTPEEDETKKRSLAEGIISDLANQRQEIDVIKQAMQVIVTQLSENTKMVEQQTLILNQLATGGKITTEEVKQGLNLESLNALSDVAEKLMSVWKNYKGGDKMPALIDQDTINKEMQSAFFDNLNTGKSINNFVKDALKKKATKEILSDTMQHLGHDEHAPQ